MKQKIHFITVGIFLSLIFGFAIAFLILPDRGFSEQENRSLRTLPRLTVQGLSSGVYASEINDYFADQFPLRDALVTWKSGAELAWGKGENDGILLGYDGQLAKRLFDISRIDGSVAYDMDAPDTAHLEAAAQGILNASSALEQKAIPFCVLLTGRTLDVCASAFAYPTEHSDRILATLERCLGDTGVYSNSIERMRQRYEAGEAVYYKTDHHWTTLGAYYAYTDIMRQFGLEGEILPKEAFERIEASKSFYGSFYSAGGMRFVAPDTVEIWRRGNEDAFTVIADGKELGGFYQWEHLKGKDQYALFLDGVHDVVTVRKSTSENRPRLVIFKDSFANSVAPFLAQHFDLVLLNLSSTRTDYTDVSRYCEQYGADAALVVYTLGNVIETEKMNRLR